MDFAPTHHAIRKFKRTILHQLRVKPAIRAEVDVFEEDSPHGRVDLCAGFVRLHSEGDSFRGKRAGQRGGEQDRQRENGAGGCYVSASRTRMLQWQFARHASETLSPGL